MRASDLADAGRVGDLRSGQAPAGPGWWTLACRLAPRRPGEWNQTMPAAVDLGQFSVSFPSQTRLMEASESADGKQDGCRLDCVPGSRGRPSNNEIQDNRPRSHHRARSREAIRPRSVALSQHSATSIGPKLRLGRGRTRSNLDRLTSRSPHRYPDRCLTAILALPDGCEAPALAGIRSGSVHWRNAVRVFGGAKSETWAIPRQAYDAESKGER